MSGRLKRIDELDGFVRSNDFWRMSSGEHQNMIYELIEHCELYGFEHQLMKQTLEKYAMTSYGSLARETINKLEESNNE